MTQPGGGCFRCPQVSKTLLKLTIRHPADQAAAEPAVSTSSANHIPHPPAMRVGRHRRFLQLPHPLPLHLLPDLSLPSGEKQSWKVLCRCEKLFGSSEKSQFMCTFVFRCCNFFCVFPVPVLEGCYWLLPSSHVSRMPLPSRCSVL